MRPVTDTLSMRTRQVPKHSQRASVERMARLRRARLGSLRRLAATRRVQGGTLQPLIQPLQKPTDQKVLSPVSLRAHPAATPLCVQGSDTQLAANSVGEVLASCASPDQPGGVARCCASSLGCTRRRQRQQRNKRATHWIAPAPARPLPSS